MPFCREHQHAFINVCSFCVIDRQKGQQLQMMSIFGALKVGDKFSTVDCKQMVKEAANKARERCTNEMYFCDATDRVYINVGQNQQLATKYFQLSFPEKGSMLHTSA